MSKETLIEAVKALVDAKPYELQRIKELEVFIEQIYLALRDKRIYDFDTNWRMVERVMPLDLECLHEKDGAEISGAYRKIHLSDILSAARELINLHHRNSAPQALTPEQREELVREIATACFGGYDESLRPAAEAALAVAEKRLLGRE